MSFRERRFLITNLRDSLQVDLKTKVSKVDKDIVIAQDASTAFDVLNKALILVVNDYAPLTKSKSNYQNLPNWFNNKLEKLRARRNTAHPYWMKEIDFKS